MSRGTEAGNTVVSHSSGTRSQQLWLNFIVILLSYASLSPLCGPHGCASPCHQSDLLFSNDLYVHKELRNTFLCQESDTQSVSVPWDDPGSSVWSSLPGLFPRSNLSLALLLFFT